jgi:hypothetical protein
MSCAHPALPRIAVVVFLGAQACSSTPPAPPPVDGGADAGEAGAALCARESRQVLGGESIVVCEEAFASAPLVRLPPDSESNGAQLVYGGIMSRAPGDVIFAGRNKNYAVVTTQPWLAAESASGNVRYGYLLYRAQVRGGAIESVTPFARIDDRVFQTVLAGKILEGMASPRTAVPGGEAMFPVTDLNVPLRIRLESSHQPSERDQLTGFPRFALVGHIENASKAVRASDGRCLASLSSLGERSPVFSATAEADRIFILRHPNMHGTLDDVFTMDWPAGVSNGNNMGTGLFLATADLIQSTAPNPTEASSHPHGNPTSAPSIELRVVSGGGGDCIP